MNIFGYTKRTINTNNMTLQGKIMRGIYYAYFLRLVSMPGVIQGFAMLGILIALTHFVSIGNVIQNFSHVEVSRIGSFIYNSVLSTEMWTLLLLGLFIFLSLSLRVRLIPKHNDSYAFARG